MGKREIGYLSLLSSALLIIGVMDLPYGFYNLLRVVVFISSFLLVYRLTGFRKGLHNIAMANNFLILFIAIGLLWNPIIPVYFDKQLWIPLDVVGSCIFIFFYSKLNEVFIN